MMFQCCTATTGGEDDTGLIDPYVFRGDDFIGLPAFQYTVLVDARRMGESIMADDGFVGLYRHPHQTGYQLAGSDDLPGVDTDIEIQIFVTGNRHHDFFEGGVTGPFAEAVDRHFDLPCSVLYGG